MMSPTYSSGVATATSTTGSRSTGLHRSATLRKAVEPGQLEGDVGGVHGVVGAVVALGREVHHRIAGDDPPLGRLLDPPVHGGQVLAGDHAALDGVDELVALAPRPSA